MNSKSQITPKDFLDVLSGCDLKIVQDWVEFANIISSKENLGVKFDREFGYVMNMIAVAAGPNSHVRFPNEQNEEIHTLSVRIWASRIAKQKFSSKMIDTWGSPTRPTWIRASKVGLQRWHLDNETSIQILQNIFDSYEDNSNLSYIKRLQLIRNILDPLYI